MEKLEAALRRARFDELRENYDDPTMTDSSLVVITVVYDDGSEKRVRHDHGEDSAPRVLNWLENRIDAIAGTRPYIGPWWEEDD